MKPRTLAAAVLTIALLDLPLAAAAAVPASADEIAPPQPARAARIVKTKRPASSKAPMVASALRQEIPVAERDYRQALLALQNGRVAETQSFLRLQLQTTPEHLPARKLLSTLLLDAGKHDEAEKLLDEGQALQAGSTDIAMALARLQADRGALSAAQETLQKSAAYAQTNGPYLAFMAALEQQAGRHDKAEVLLTAALKIQPGNGEWLLAQGVSCQKLQDVAGARHAVEAALASGQLTLEQQKQAQRLLVQLRRAG